MIAAMEALLGVPGVVDDGGGRAALPLAQGRAEKGMMAVVPGGFDQHAPQMGIAGFGDRAARLFGAARMLRRHEADKGHRPRGGREPPRVAEFGGDGQRGEIVDAAETAQALDAGPQRLQREQVPQIGIDRCSRATASSTART